MQVETEDPGAASALNTILTALEKAEEGNPGIVHELVRARKRPVPLRPVLENAESTPKEKAASRRDTFCIIN